MSEELGALTAKVASIEKTMIQLIRGPFTEMKTTLAEQAANITELETKIAELQANPPAKRKSGGKRLSLHKKHWLAVQSALDADPNGKNSWKTISETTGIPQSTCRKLSKMTPEEVAALPEGKEVVDDSGQADDTE